MGTNAHHSASTIREQNIAPRDYIGPNLNPKIQYNDLIWQNQKSYNAKNEQYCRVKSFQSLTGSKSLDFGLPCTKGTITTIENSTQISNTDKEILNKNEQKTALVPITFPTLTSQGEMSQTNDARSGQKSSCRANCFSPSKVGQKQMGKGEGQFNFLLDNSYMEELEEFQFNVSKEYFIRMRRWPLENDYQIGEKLGEGSFGRVMLCHNKINGEARAVKILKKSILIDPKVKEQFSQEFSILKKLDHPNIVRIYEIYQGQQSLSLVFEVCQGSSLATLLKEEIDLSLEVKREILRQLFRGINYLHSQGIVHRDIKPDNIVFVKKLTSASSSSDVDLRIIDFGLAYEHKEKTFKDWANIGTYNFMAPEVFDGLYSSKCDSWSCGIVAHILLLGSNPFRGFDKEQVRMKLRNYSPNPQKFNSIDPSIAELLLSLNNLNHIIRWSVKQALSCNFFKTQTIEIDRNNLLMNLGEFLQGEHFASVVHSYLCFKNCKQEELSRLSKQFLLIDTDQNGAISEAELRNHFPELSQQQIEKIFRKIDKNGSKTIDFTQFVTAFSKKSDFLTQLNLKDAFSFIDINKNGTISCEQLKFFLRTFDKLKIEQIVNRMKQDKNEGICFQQFSAFLMKQKGC